jgi:hypothetical protein
MEWESWLAEHHDRSRDVRLLIAKKGSSKVSATIDDALDIALCYGWIDSQRKGHDADHYLQRYSPRRPRSRQPGLLHAGKDQHTDEGHQPGERQPSEEPRFVLLDDVARRLDRSGSEVDETDEQRPPADRNTQKPGPTRWDRYSTRPMSRSG